MTLLAALLLAGAMAAQDEENLDVITGWRQYSDAENNAYHHFYDEAMRLLNQRAETVATIDSAEGWRERRRHVRKALAEAVGPFPERAALNVEVHGTLRRDGYRVEKLTYESVPGFYVTAALFVPDELDAPAPGILFCSGHAAEGFRAPAYQTMILNLVDKGFVVLAFDPVGQGDRLQYDVETVGGPTKQHSYPGAQGFLLGGSPARQMIWDGIRGLDVLASRDEVDAERLGVTGRSGGGTQTAYIAAFDDRVAAAAPEAYITTMERLLSSAGPQDVEQIFLHSIQRGLEHADFILARAPKPTLVIATTRDFFSIQGARETHAEMKRAYAALGKPDAVKLVEDDAPHASTRKNREAMYAFFQETLGHPGNAIERDVPLWSVEELNVTRSLGGKTLYDLNVDGLNTDAHTDDVVASARRLSGYRAPESQETPVFAGRYPRDGYVVEKYLLEGSGTDVLPYLLMIPSGPSPHPLLLYLHPGGKSVNAVPDGEMERLVRAGYMVAAPDLLGTGETGPGDFRGDAQFGSVSYNLWFASILVGRSLVGERARDIVRLALVLSRRADVEAGDVSAVAYDELGPVLLHAAAFEPVIRRVALMRPLVSYRALVRERDYAPRFIPSAVAGALTAYDLPELAASLQPRSLLAAGVTDAKGEPVASQHVQAGWSDAWSIRDTADIDALINWLGGR